MDVSSIGRGDGRLTQIDWRLGRNWLHLGLGMPHMRLMSSGHSNSLMVELLTAGYTIKSIVRNDTRNVRCSCPYKQHHGGCEREENQSIDRANLLRSNQGKDSTKNGAAITYSQAANSAPAEAIWKLLTRSWPRMGRIHWQLRRSHRKSRGSR